VASLRGASLPGVNYARNPSTDPEKNVDAELFSKQLSGRSADVINQGINAPAPGPRSMGVGHEQEIARI
jgi:hypothetical protein